MIRLHRAWPIIIIVSALLTGFAVFADLVTPIRPLLGFWFLIVCPGMAYVRLLNLQDTISELTLAVALSLVIDTIVASTLLHLGAWSINWILIIIIVISVGGAITQLTLSLARNISEPSKEHA